MKPLHSKTNVIQEQIKSFIEQGFIEEARTIELAARKKGDLSVSVLTELELSKFLTIDPKMLALKNKVRMLTDVDDPVLISGPTGTGKEIIAKALHASREGKFIEINCAAIPSELLESELFGHVKGSFTGAINDKTGLMQNAHNGTLFLDEISEMPLTMQAKMLRALQEMKIRKIGGEEMLPVKFHLVCATNRNIDKVIQEGKFRLDLYYRISTIELFTLPLSARFNDIRHISNALDKSGRFYQWLERTNMDKHPFPGNVRELMRMVKRWELFGEE